MRGLHRQRERHALVLHVWQQLVSHRKYLAQLELTFQLDLLEVAEVLRPLRRGGVAIRARAALNGGGQGARLVGLAQLLLCSLRVEESAGCPSVTSASLGCTSAVAWVALSS